jgi:High potential iron-sulfur protein
MINRRRKLNSALFTALIGLLVERGSRALGAAPVAPRAPLDERDAAAKAVAYQQDARKVDPRVFPTYRRGQSCATCALIEFGTARLRGCSLFPGKLVASAGWCSVWRLRGGKS